MIRRLRWKFVLIIMSLVTVILAMMFFVVLATTQDSLRRDSLSALDQAITLTGDTTPSYSEHITSDNEGTSVLFGAEKVQLPYFTIQLSMPNTIYVLANQFFDTSDQTALLEVVDAAMEQTSDTGSISTAGYSLRYLRANTLLGYRIAFVDLTQEQSTLTALARNLVFIGLGTLVLFFFISLVLARWAIRPVERSWRQQHQFVADASHELKTPLAVISSSLDMLDQYGETEPDKRQRWLENVRASSTQMQTLVEELLVLARSDNATQPLTLARCDFSEVVEDSLLLFEPIAYEQGKTMDEALAPGLLVSGDTALLKRIVDIYLDNACKYGRRDSVIHVALTGESKRVLLSVRSEGEPISKELLGRIFERFYRTDPSRTEEGYGLGLAIALELARLHRGKVWAESDEAGNTFFFSLPRLREIWDAGSS